MIDSNKVWLKKFKAVDCKNLKPHNKSVQKQIIVFGGSGAGKSSTINSLIGIRDHAEVGKGKDSCTSIATSFQAVIGSHKVNLIDTPGLDDTRQEKSNQDIMYEIVKKIIDSETGQIDAIIFIEDSNDSRSNCLKQLKMLQNALGYNDEDQFGASVLCLATKAEKFYDCKPKQLAKNVKELEGCITHLVQSLKKGIDYYAQPIPWCNDIDEEAYEGACDLLNIDSETSNVDPWEFLKFMFDQTLTSVTPVKSRALKDLRSAFNEVKSEYKKKNGFKMAYRGPFTVKASSSEERCGFLWLSVQTVWVPSAYVEEKVPFDGEIYSFHHYTTGDGHCYATQTGVKEITLSYKAYKSTFTVNLDVNLSDVSEAKIKQINVACDLAFKSNMMTTSGKIRDPQETKKLALAQMKLPQK